MRLIFSPRIVNQRGGHLQRQGFADVFGMGGEKELRAQGFEIGKGLGAAGEDGAANGGELVFGGGAKNPQSGDGVVARENDDFGQGLAVLVLEGQEFFDQGERDSGGGGAFHPLLLQFAVGAGALGVKDAVFLLKVKQRARGDGDDQRGKRRGSGHGYACAFPAGRNRRLKFSVVSRATVSSSVSRASARARAVSRT